MRTLIKTILVATMFLSLVAVPAAFGNPISDLYSTGAGITPPAADLHWTVAQLGGAQSTAYAPDPNLFPFPYWFPDNGNSQWISPQRAYSNETPGDTPDTTYVFQTQFTLPTVFDAWISFLVATDNALIDVKLNGNEVIAPTTSVVLPGDSTATNVIQDGFGSGLQGPLTINSGFQAGTNTLTFFVRNSRTNDANTGNPVGLNVDIVGSAATPEPAAMLLIGTGLACVAMLGRRRRSKR
jgi:hypothetical protein